MIIVKIQGGLGNQMFLYALYQSFLESGRDATIDISHYPLYKLHNGFEIDKIFNTQPRIATKKERNRLGDVRLDVVHRTIRRFIGIRKKSHYLEQKYQYKPEIGLLDQKYLEGYFQSEKYFSNIESKIREVFTFKHPLDEKNQQIADQMVNGESISIHIRRGDYINHPSFAGTCGPSYYAHAIEQMVTQVNTPQFFVFSDDIAWVKENMTIPNPTYIDWNTGAASYKDLQLMSLCKHNIIANSSFSWWGAWLNHNPAKCVIAPKKWYANDLNTEDLIPERWLRIE